MAPSPEPDWDHIQALMRAVAEDGDAAWHALLTTLVPHLVQFARRQPIGRLREQEDTPREIVTRVLARLHKNDYAALKKMFAEEPPPHPRAWLRVLVKRAAIDYMRAQPEFHRGSDKEEPHWVTLVSLMTRHGMADPATLAFKRREVISFVTEAVNRALELVGELGDEAIDRLAVEWQIPRIHVRRLINKGAQLSDVLSSVLEGQSYNQVAERLSLTRREVQLNIKYIEELLDARRFGASNQPGSGRGD